MTGGTTAVYVRACRGCRWLVRDTAGASLVEYILLLALVAIVAGAGVKHLGLAAKQSLNRIGLAMPASEGGSSDSTTPRSGSGGDRGQGGGNGAGNGGGNGRGNGQGNGNRGGNFQPPRPAIPPR